MLPVSGVLDTFGVREEEGWVPPTVEEQYKPDRTILTLTFKEKQAEKTSGKDRQKKQAEKTGRKSRRKKQTKAEERLKTKI